MFTQNHENDVADRENQNNVHEDPNFKEERFRVDRRKLEQMLLSTTSNENPLGISISNNYNGARHNIMTDDETFVSEEAERFFRKVMEDTDTVISWPSKLKIGAKSKKDPHIKVSGKPHSVALAKEKILDVLDTRSNKVTLKLDVSHTDHSHVIGKGGNNIKSVMAETGCHIHFPDSNRTNQTQDKSNQVSIAGQPEGVEQARIKIRELLPLMLMFDLHRSVTAEETSSLIQQVQQMYNLTVTFKMLQMGRITVIVRGCANNVPAVKQSTAFLVDRLTGQYGKAVLVSTQLEIAPQHHQSILGNQGTIVQQIMAFTGAHILFPGHNFQIDNQRKGTVYITGGIDSVIQARQCLIEHLPVVLMFDMKEEIEVEPSFISQLKEELDVFICVKPKVKQSNKSVIVKTCEKNAMSLYIARCRLLRIECPHVTKPRNPNAQMMGLLSANFLKMNTNPLLMMNGTSKATPLLTNQHPSKPIITNQSTALLTPGTNNIITTSSHLYNSNVVMMNNSSPLNLYPTNQYCTAVDDRHNVVKPPATPTHVATAHTPTHSMTTFNQQQSPRSVPKQLTGLQDDNRSSIRSSTNSSLSNSPHELFKNPTALDYGDGSVFDGGDFMSGKEHKLHSSSTSDLLADRGLPNPALATSINGVQLSSSTSSLPSRHSTLSGAASLYSSHNSALHDESLPPLQDLNLADQLPGILFNTHSLLGDDYEKKSIMATKAIQKKPEGESRTPTPVWAGFGFSQSSPACAIKKEFEKRNINYPGPNMITTYENPVSEASSYIDKSPWINSTHKRDDYSLDTDLNQHETETNMAVQTKSDLNNGASSNHSHTTSDWMSMYHQPSNQNASSVIPMTPVQDLNQQTLAEIFAEKGLVKYTNLFQQQEIDLETFLTLTEADLKNLGIPTFGARRKIVLAIADLQKQSSSTKHSISINNGAPRSTAMNQPRTDKGGDFHSFRDSSSMHQNGNPSLSYIW